MHSHAGRRRASPAVADVGDADAAAPAVAQAQLPPDLPPPPPGYPPAYATAPGLTARGEAVVRVEPDVAFISTGVLTRGQTAQAAQDENTRLMAAVIQAIRAAGVAEQDIRTSGVALHPVYDRQPNAITGYQAVNTVRITVQDVAKTGGILDAAVTAGANQASNVQFGLKDDSAPRRQAFGEAVKAARADADAMAAAAGLRIVGVQSLVDESAGGPTSPEFGRVAMAAPASAGPVPVQPGQLAVTARVRVVYSFQ
jgi:uncharacterized protein YggE